MEKKYLSDCIRYTTDIAPYPFIQSIPALAAEKTRLLTRSPKAMKKASRMGAWKRLSPNASCASPRAEPKLTS